MVILSTVLSGCARVFVAGCLTLALLLSVGFAGVGVQAQTTELDVFWSSWGPLYNELMTNIGERYEV